MQEETLNPRRVKNNSYLVNSCALTGSLGGAARGGVSGPHRENEVPARTVETRRVGLVARVRASPRSRLRLRKRELATSGQRGPLVARRVLGTTNRA
jgi:hypothetical protein